MGTFLKQTYYLLYRNFLLKRRNKTQTGQELIIPLLFVLNLAAISLNIPQAKYDAIPSSQLQTQPLYVFLPNGSMPLGFTPNTTETTTIMMAAAERLNITAYPQVIGYATEADLIAGYRTDPQPFENGIVFENDFPGNLSYKIRLPYGRGPSAGHLRTGSDSCRNGTDCPAARYLWSGFAALQVAMDFAIASVVGDNTTLPFPSVWFQMFPKPSYLTNSSVIRLMSAIYYVIMFTPFIAILVSNLVSEKEKKIKECMKIMGMREPAFWVAWGITYFIIIAIISVFIVGLSFAIRVFIRGNFFLIYLYFISYGLSIVTLSFMLTPFFNKAVVAGAAAGFFSMLISLLYLPLTLISGISPVWQWLLCLFSPVAIALGMDKTTEMAFNTRKHTPELIPTASTLFDRSVTFVVLISAVAYETEYGGLTFDTVSLGDFPPMACLVMLIVDAVLYLVLAMYFANVIPSVYGQRKPPWFFLLPSYWWPDRKIAQDRIDLLASANNEETTVNANINPDDIELVTADVRDRNSIRIRGLVKKFPGNKRKGKPDVLAVNGITLDIYEGQITCLLGHNGAGKSTLINALTGLLDTNSGSATVYGYNISNPLEMDNIRSMTGVCSQENTLFDYLSPEEHLKVYAGLKGLPDEEIENEVKRILKEVELDKQSATHSKDLSGGQKRKLCVAMALIGNPKVLFLDEPSSGMDPYSRRQLWGLLKKQREGRVTLLTTHFMDEADILADRKAVISKGSLRCCGSSLFLKNRFGIGYHLGMVVEQNCDVDPITSLVQGHVPEAKVSRSHGMELSYTLPLKDVSSFAGLFEALDKKNESSDSSVAAAMGIQSYGVSMTTLEEVFLKLAEDEANDDDDDDDDDKDARGDKPNQEQNGRTNQKGERTNAALVMEENNHRNQDTTTVEFKESPLDSTVLATKPIAVSHGQQIKAMTWIWGILLLRNPGTITFRIIFPCLYFVLSVFIVQWVNFGNSDQNNPASLTLDPNLYLAGVDDDIGTKTALLYKDSLPLDQNISYLLSEFSNNLEVVSQSHANLSDLLTIAPHSVALDVANISKTNAQFTVLYNDTTVHALPVAINIISNSLYSLLEGLQTDQKISTTNHPLPARQLAYSFNSGILFVVFFGFAILGLPVGFAVELIKERQVKARAQLRVSGVESWTFWTARFIVDFAQFAVVTLFGIIIIVALQMPSLIQPGALFLFIVFLILYIPADTLSAYCVSFAFKDFETAQGFLPMLYSYLSFIPGAPVVVLDFLGHEGAAAALHLILCLVLPPYSIFGMAYYIDKVYRFAVFFGTEDQLTFGDYFKMDNYIVPTILVVLISVVGLFFFLRYVEIRSTGGDPRDTCPGGSARRTLKHTKVNTDKIEGEDSDVISERGRVQEIFEQDKNCVVAINSLRREFVKRTSGGMCKKTTKEERTKIAVRNLSLAVNHGEVMGLLGPNGAGKTTTLNTVIAEHEPTKGQVRVAGHDITSSETDAFRAMGYCPQVDPLWDEITMREHLEAYATIKGIHKSDIKHVTEHYMKCLGITEHADKRGKALSGGNKRKLCYAISMLGDPQVVLLDEPSTGMDPKSKRFLWNAITASFIDKRGAILTTHSMEEADAVCSRVGIMVMGQLVCLGTTQHLKNKYGGGYILEVKLKIEIPHHQSTEAQRQAQDSLDDKIEALHKYVHEMLPEAEVTESFGERITYKIPKKSVASLSSVFAAMEEGKEVLGIEEYSFSQSTLEQVFIEFAKKQEEDEREEQAGDTSVQFNRQVSVQSEQRPQDEGVGRATFDTPC